jgi:hypothetical protein
VLELYRFQVKEEGPSKRKSVEDAAKLDHLSQVPVVVQVRVHLTERLENVKHKHAVA